MKKIFALVVVVAMVLGLSAAALAQNNSAKLLGTWEVEYPEYGKFTVKVDASGVGEMHQDGVALGQFAFTVRENWMAGAEVGEDGKPAIEAGEIQFVDADTIVSVEDGQSVTFHRVAAAEADALSMDNVFVGSWVADLPDAKGARMEYKPEGTMTFSAESIEGEFEMGYLVFGDLLAILSDEGELEQFSFVVVDENSLDVTEIATGETARFVRIGA